MEGEIGYVHRHQASQMLLIASFQAFLHNESQLLHAGGICETVSGPKVGAACVFPFTYQGRRYNGCPVDPEDLSKRWCSTLVDGNGLHVGGQGEYGHCAPACPTDDNGTPVAGGGDGSGSNNRPRQQSQQQSQGSGGGTSEGFFTYTACIRYRHARNFLFQGVGARTPVAQLASVHFDSVPRSCPARGATYLTGWRGSAARISPHLSVSSC